MTKSTIAEKGKKTQWKPGQSGNPKGKPKGAIHLSTRIQRLMDDPKFKLELKTKAGKKKTVKGIPAELIIKTALSQAISGDDRARTWLAKFGYGENFLLGNDPENPLPEAGTGASSAELGAMFVGFIKEATKAPEPTKPKPKAKPKTKAKKTKSKKAKGEK